MPRWRKGRGHLEPAARAPLEGKAEVQHGDEAGHLRRGTKGGQEGRVPASKHLQQLQLLGGPPGVGSLGQHL